MVSNPSFTSGESHTSADTEVTPPTFKKVVIGDATLYLGDAADVLPHLSDIDACVADGPYGLSFMGKAWDYGVPKADLWALVKAALKPGAFVVNFASARTYHRMAVEVEDGGFQIRDQLMWLRGNGYQITRDIAKDIDRLAGEKRPVIGKQKCPGYADAASRHGKQTQNVREFDKLSSEPICEDAMRWQGWGTGLKPSHEPIVLGRKPMIAENTAENVLQYGVGALNIDASSDGVRKPGNVLHDGSDEVLVELGHSASFFYCAKASTKEREFGLENFLKSQPTFRNGNASSGKPSSTELSKGKTKKRANDHPTVKPLALMRWLNRLITPPGGLIIDPFLGTGSTGVAALQDGFRFIGIERDQKSFKIACARIAAAQR